MNLTRRAVIAGFGLAAAGWGRRVMAGGLHYGVVVYGATPSGAIAACAAAREGVRVALVSGNCPVGGMCAQGLGSTDIGDSRVVGGLALDVFQRNGKAYGQALQWHFEPHRARAVFCDLLTEFGVTWIDGELAQVAKSGTAIVGITLADGTQLRANVFCDSSYEGDLLALAGASWRVGRESKAEYGEALAGYNRYPTLRSARAYDDAGHLLPGLTLPPALAVGAADQAVQAYFFRLCLTQDAANRVPFPKPAGYDPWRYEFIRRRLTSSSRFRAGPLGLNGKYDLNGDYIGASWAYPTANAAQRRAIVQDHYTYQAGLLYFLANNAGVPASYRDSINAYGLCSDEFTDSGYWPTQLYIREARRLVGMKVLRQQDTQIHTTKPDSIGMGAYGIDCHFTGLIALGQNKVNFEGSMANGAFKTVPYQLPFRCLLPTPHEVSNLVVSVCVSASHVAFCSLRMEVQYMIMGEAAGLAAAVACRNHAPLHAVGSQVISSLKGYGAVLTL